jgi:hypothetical protein
MMKHLVRGVMCTAMLLAVTPALAIINPEPFTAPEYVAGNALSAFYWTAGNDTTGVLDIEEVGGDHGRVAKLTADGPVSGFAQIFAKVDTGWGGPGRDAGKMWYAVDIEMGTGDGSTSLTDFIWKLAFAQPSNAVKLTLDGGLTTFRLRANNEAFVGGTFNLHPGWNQVAVMNDNTMAFPNLNTFVYHDGVEVASYSINAGQINSNPSVDDVTLTRNARGEHFVGMMRFDNIITANEDILVPEPATLALMGLAAPALFWLGRRRSV